MRTVSSTSTAGKKPATQARKPPTMRKLVAAAKAEQPSQAAIDATVAAVTGRPPSSAPLIEQIQPLLTAGKRGEAIALLCKLTGESRTRAEVMIDGFAAEPIPPAADAPKPWRGELHPDWDKGHLASVESLVADLVGFDLDIGSACEGIALDLAVLEAALAATTLEEGSIANETARTYLLRVQMRTRAAGQFLERLHERGTLEPDPRFADQARKSAVQS